eukprot:7656885-Pyramimonas_sp.AAC.1
MQQHVVEVGIQVATPRREGPCAWPLVCSRAGPDLAWQSFVVTAPGRHGQQRCPPYRMAELCRNGA